MRESKNEERRNAQDLANNAPNMRVNPRESIQILRLQVKSVTQTGMKVRTERYNKMLPINVTTKNTGEAAFTTSRFQFTNTKINHPRDVMVKNAAREAIAISSPSQSSLYSRIFHLGNGKTGMI